MDIYKILKEENQRFWDFLDLDQAHLNPLVDSSQQQDESDTVEAIEQV